MYYNFFMSNFNFLKRINENLFIIAYEAEKLFRDEYFEQCITQTRRLAEAALNYAVFKKGLDSKYLQQQFDDELLATGKKTKKPSLTEKYDEEKTKNAKKRKNSKKSSSKSKKIKYDDESEEDIYRNMPDKDNKKPLWREILETVAAGLVIAVVYFLIFNK